MPGLAIQVVHRFGALVVLTVVGALIYRLARARHWLAWPLLAVLALQLSLGVANVVLLLPLWVATAHNAFGAVTLLLVITVNYGALQPRPEVSTSRLAQASVLGR